MEPLNFKKTGESDCSHKVFGDRSKIFFNDYVENVI